MKKILAFVFVLVLSLTAVLAEPQSSNKEIVSAEMDSKVCCAIFGYGANMEKVDLHYEEVFYEKCRIPERFVGGGREIVDYNYCKKQVDACPMVAIPLCSEGSIVESYKDSNGCMKYRCKNSCPIEFVTCEPGTTQTSYVDDDGCTKHRCVRQNCPIVNVDCAEGYVPSTYKDDDGCEKSRCVPKGNNCAIELPNCVIGASPEYYIGEDGCNHARCVKESVDVNLKLDEEYSKGEPIKVTLVNEMDVPIYYLSGPCKSSFSISRGESENLELMGPIRCLAMSVPTELAPKESVAVGTWDAHYYEVSDGIDWPRKEANPGNYVVTVSYGMTPEDISSTAKKRIKLLGGCPKYCEEKNDICLCSTSRSDTRESGKGVPVAKGLVLDPKSRSIEARLDLGSGSFEKEVLEEKNAIKTAIHSSGNIVEVGLSFDVDKDSLKISSNDVEASTQENISIEEGMLFISKDGFKKQVNLLPDAALEKARTLELRMEQVELKGGETPFYSGSGVREGKLFGVFGISYSVEAQISAENGDIVIAKKPWYDFLVKKANIG